MTTTKLMVPAITATLCLGACSDEPSQAAMSDAFAAVFARMTPPQMSVANLQLGGKAAGHVDDPPDVTNLRKVGCEKATAGDGWTCAFSVTINGIPRPSLSGRFHRGPDGVLVVADR